MATGGLLDALMRGQVSSILEKLQADQAPTLRRIPTEVRYVHRILERPFEPVVDRVNPVEAGMHMRLLVRLTGELVT